MANENENQSLREYGKRRKRYKRIRNLIILILILAAAAVGIIYIIYLYNKSYHDYKAVSTIEMTGDTTVGYLSYGSGIIKYSKDGAQAYDKDGKVIWNAAYEMTDPIASVSGQYVVVADRGGEAVHIFSNKGEVGNYKVLYNITDVEIASKQGVTAIMMTEGEDNYFNLYDVDGTPLVDINKGNNVNNAGYPLDMALSNDGTKLVISYLSVTSGELVSNVTCYNFSEVGKNYIDNMAGNYPTLNGVIVPKVVFLNNEVFCSFKDNGFMLCSMKEQPKKINEVTFDGKIKSVLYNKNYAGVVLETADGTSKHMLLYNLNGKQVLDKTIDFEYTMIFLTDEEIIMYNDTSCIIMKMDGRVKFKDTFESSITAFYPINNLDRYYLVSEEKLSDIQLLD
jgi:hypothetical protein